MLYCLVTRQYRHLIMSKGGRTSTTWETGSRWKGETKTARIPVDHESKIMDYARELDANDGDVVTLQAQLILEAIDQYIELKRENYHANQHSKELNIGTRPWDELRKFKKMLQENPQVLGLGITRNNL